MTSSSQASSCASVKSAGGYRTASLGELFVESEEFKSLQGGKAGANMVAPFTLNTGDIAGTFSQKDVYAALPSGDRPGNFGTRERDPIVIPPTRTRRIRDLFPARTTTAAVIDAVSRWSQQCRAVPELRFVNRYHDDAGYIEALAQRIETHWQAHGRGDRLVMSFHGIPERTLQLGDPYHCECYKTARLLGERLGLSPTDYQVTFQSRFGKAKWLEPYTEPTVRQLAHNGVKRLDVVCPGFTSDCLETLEEIAMEVREAFLTDGGEVFHYIPCLNADPRWIEALAGIAQQHLSGWPLTSTASATLQASRAAALGLGAID